MASYLVCWLFGVLVILHKIDEKLLKCLHTVMPCASQNFDCDFLLNWSSCSLRPEFDQPAQLSGFLQYIIQKTDPDLLIL